MSASTPPPPQRYCCQEQQSSVPIASPASPDAKVLCPPDVGGFVEEEPLDATPSPTTPRAFASLLHSFDIRHPSDLAIFLGTPSPTASPAAAASPPGQFDATNFLHGHLSGILSGGATIQVVVEGSPDGINLGDYYMEPSPDGLEQLIEQLALNDPNRYGTLPAAKYAVVALPNVAVSADMMAADGGAQCAVCTDDFVLGAMAKQLPCNHMFHKDCILPWLDLHSSCPVCRFELPTDDTDYEHLVAGGHASVSAEPAAVTPGTPGSCGTPSPRVGERMLRISLPWPVRAAFGCETATSTPSSQDAAGGDHYKIVGHSSYEDLD